jgi:4-amino-4-deoxy-L-arabinose transferase-like glycosyltransferase
MWCWLPLGLLHSWNEAYYLLRVTTLVQGGSYYDGVFDNPPLFVYTLTALAKLGGVHELLFRFVSILCTLITTGFLYLISKVFLKNKAAIFSAALFTFFPMTVLFSKIIQIDMFAIMFMTASFYFAVVGTQKNRLWLLISGAFFGLGILTKFPTALVIFPLFYYWYRYHVQCKYIALFIGVSFVISLPWFLYTFIVNPAFLTAGVASSSNLFGLGSMHTDAPYYQLAMIVLAVGIFLLILVLLLKYKPNTVEQKTLALFSLVYAGFFLVLPNHEYYLLPVLVPLFLYIVLRLHTKVKMLKTMVSTFLIISILLVIVRPVYEINWKKAVEELNEYSDVDLVYSTNPAVIRYYIQKNVTWLHPELNASFSTHNVAVLFTWYDTFNLKDTQLFSFIEEHYVLLEDVDGKIFLYGSPDIHRGIV